MQNIMRVFSVVLLIMVGTVFAVGPAGLIVTLCKNSGMSGLLTTTLFWLCLLYTSPSPRDRQKSRMPSSA